MDFGPCATKINTDGYGDNEDISDDSEVQTEAVSSFFPHKALFKINFRPKQNEEIITCLAEQSVRNRRQIHPLLLRFLHEETKNKESSFLEKESLRFIQNTREMILYSVLILIITLLNGMIGLCWILITRRWF